MTIPLFAVGPTASPYREISDFTGGQSTALNSLTRAQEDVGKAFVGMGGQLGELGKEVFSYAMKVREQQDLNDGQERTMGFGNGAATFAEKWKAGVTGENVLDATKALEEGLRACCGTGCCGQGASVGWAVHGAGLKESGTGFSGRAGWGDFGKRR